MTIICQTCNKQANKKGMLIVEEPDWGNSYFFCSWKCLANFSLKKYYEQVKDAQQWEITKKNSVKKAIDSKKEI